ncbi:MAG: mechanosensitive ion channel, partial [Alphaproteobacteria bacterium]|nr:mechanosensitive ion channel [Alphaproteobacteria bacterium]
MDDKSLKSSGLDSLDPLWAMTVDIWQHGFMGVDIGKFIVALLIFAGFLLFRGLFSKYILARLHRLTRKTATQMDDRIVDALIPPIRFVPIILGLFFAVQYAGLDEKLGTFWDNTLRSLIAFTIFWAIHRALDPVSRMLKVLERTLTPTMVRWIFKVLKVLVIFMGAAVVLEVWGIQVGPLLAGLGLFGAAVALGAQEMFKNLIAGIAVIAEKKFEPGDWILVDGVVEGTVDTIGFRSTQVRRFDKAPV